MAASGQTQVLASGLAHDVGASVEQPRDHSGVHLGNVADHVVGAIEQRHARNAHIILTGRKKRRNGKRREGRKKRSEEKRKCSEEKRVRERERGRERQGEGQREKEKEKEGEKEERATKRERKREKDRERERERERHRERARARVQHRPCAVLRVRAQMCMLSLRGPLSPPFCPPACLSFDHS